MMTEKPWNERPWTWEEIAALRGEARAQFLRAYGDRAKAAIMTAGHEPGTWKKCDLLREVVLACDQCPLNYYSAWRRGLDKPRDTCSENAAAVYARMVEQLGLLPDEGCHE